MEELRGPINSFFLEAETTGSEVSEQAAGMEASCGGDLARDVGYPQVSFLQMLNAAGQLADQEIAEHDDEEDEDKQRVHFEIYQHFYRQSHLKHLLDIHHRYGLVNSAPKIKPLPPLPEQPPVQQQFESCVASREPLPAVARVDADENAVGAPKERKKRKRSRTAAAAAAATTAKDAEDIESQRRNHIAIERNRRRLMNSHLATLRSLMPSTFVQRGDQASVIAGAIDFVKQLEQQLLSLQVKKRLRSRAAAGSTTSSTSASSSCTNACDDAEAPALGEFLLLASPQYTSYSRAAHGEGAVDVEATVVQGHVSLKVVGPAGRRGQLARGVAALEELGLTVLHLTVTSLDPCSVLYSLNLKMEDWCKLGAADEIAAAVHQIFSYVSVCCGD